MNKERIEELKARAHAATKGPWMTWPTTACNGEYTGLDVMTHDGGALITEEMHPSDDDALFIAAANPTTILELIALAEHSLSAQDEVPIDEYSAIFMLLKRAIGVIAMHDDHEAKTIAANARALLAAAPSPAVAVEPWAPTEEQFEQWRARHGLHPTHTEAFYDAASLYLEATPSPSLAVRDVVAERQRQISAEGWTPEHDDEHNNSEMAMAASCYVDEAVDPRNGAPSLHWPWGDEWWKPSTPRRNLVKAGALILAEIERLDRAVKKG